MSSRPFSQVDVFTHAPLLGNPVAVVHDGTGLSAEQMLRFTEWTNLSEATFICEPTHPGADYAVRIFCPGRELPFAGHPTLGTCHAWLEAGGTPRGDHVVQECGVGLVPIRRDGAVLSFAAPPLSRSGPMDGEELAAVARFLRIPTTDVVAHAWCDNGPGWRAVLLASAEQVLALEPDPTALAGMDVGVAGLHPAGSETALEVRAFFPGNVGVAEDPVTGSLNAALAQWLIAAGHLPDAYVAAQGTALGRAGRVRVSSVGDTVWVGGACVTVVRGEVDL